MAGGSRVDRRTFLYGSASALALSAVGVGVATTGAGAAPPVRSPYRMAMHIHACFSEGDGSMEAHLYQAEQQGVDVIWWTEHDHRMVARNYLEAVHFNGLTEYSNGTSVSWRSRYEGSLQSSTASIVTTPSSPNDPGGRALQITADTSAGSMGTRRLWADANNYGLTTSLFDTSIEIEVFPHQLGDDSWADIRVQTSYRPGREGRPAGQYSVVYRVGGARPEGTRLFLNDLTALVVVGGKNMQWNALRLDAVDDLNSFWPGVDFRDSALTEFTLSATSRDGVPASATFDGLSFVRQTRSAAEVIAAQREVMDGYASSFPTVTQHQGMEMSASTPHMNWFGNPDIWALDDTANQDVGVAVRRIHRAGGIAAYNHPFGSSGGPYTTTQRINKRRSVTATLVQERIFKADCLEVGYLGGRAGMQLVDYLDLWDVLSRNAVFVTATGVSDDHNGRGWAQLQWRCTTGVWAANDKLASLQRALRAGRAWFADMAAFSGTVNVTADGYIAMGQVAIVEALKSRLTIDVKGAQPDWRVAIVMGVVDEPGATSPDPQTTRKTAAMSEAVNGVLSVRVNTSTSRFYRVELMDSEGQVVAYSNPIWLLRQAPTHAVPAVRLAQPPVEPTPTTLAPGGTP